MPARLFADLLPGRPRRRPGAFPASVTLHAFAIGAVVSVAARPVAVGMPASIASGPIVFTTPIAPRPEVGAPKPPPSRLQAAPTASRTVARGPAPVLDPANAEPSGSDDAPSPCLRNCEVGNDAGWDDVGTGFFTPDIGGGGLSGATAPVPVGGNIRPPLKLHDVVPVYPELARRARVQGMVIIRCVIDRDGRVVEAEVLRGVPLLDAAALEAVRQWTYRPTLLNGSPVAVIMSVTVQFSLQH